MKLTTFILGIRDLKNKYSRANLNEVLLELLKEFDIEYDITR
jgi:hypothetical protein